MAKIVKYVGPLRAVEIAATGQTVERGETVEIADDDLAGRLCEQATTWQTRKPTRKTKG